MSNEWCPIIFSPIYREKKWGGTLLADELNRPVPDGRGPLGESYEIIDHEEHQSVAENEPYTGSTLHELIESSPREIVGVKHCESQRFPLVLKYIDSGKPLPLQVHPASAESGGVLPNTKLWYVHSCREGAVVYAGLKRRPTRQQFLSRIGSDKLGELVQSFRSVPGEAYYISAGRVHAVSAGNLVFVVQQNTCPPYCIGDWTKGATGDRDTVSDIKAGLKAIQFQDRTLMRICGERRSVERNRRISLITTCPYFTVDELSLTSEYHEGTDGTTFHLLTAIDGDMTVNTENGALGISRGRTCLIPAATGCYIVTPQGSTVKMLKTALRTV